MQHEGAGFLSLTRPAPPDISTARIKKELEDEAAESLGVGRTLSSGKRTVCDHCRRRRIRCDGQFPCQQCNSASLVCKRDHVPKKRGPKRGHGRVINELRARESKTGREVGSGHSSDVDPSHRHEPRLTYAISVDANQPNSASTSAPPSPPAQPFVPWTAVTPDLRNAPEPQGAYTSDEYQPRSRNYLHLIPRCVELYYDHIYPIMPLLHMPSIRSTIVRPMTFSERNLIYALSALTAFHMSGKSLASAGQPPWEEVGRFFLDECISVRSRYDFPEDTSLYAVISSFWLSTSFFEINQSRKSWFYLREALTLAIDIGLHDDRSYVGFNPQDVLCRQRVFWILFVTERSFAILRNKPLTLRKTPHLPTTKHSYESPDIHTGFLKLVGSYIPLDESFVTAWNDGSDPRVSATTYLNLQRTLGQPLGFLRPSRKSSRGSPLALTSGTSPTEREEDEPDPTPIQKADLMVTQQWLRLIVWQSSFRQGLLSTAATDESFRFSFPLSIARDTAAILHSLPSQAVEVHGMGIFEKIFEIGTWSVNVMGAYDAGSANPSRPFGGAANSAVGGMDFVGGELSLFGPSGRSGAVLDPVEFFIKTLSASPNSKTMFADKLLMFAQHTPGGMRTSLSPVLPTVSSTAATSGRVVEEVTGEEATSNTLTEALDSDGSPVIMGNGLGNTMVGLGTGNAPGLSIITARSSSGYGSIQAGLRSAGLSAAFSDLGTGDHLYGASADDFVQDMGGFGSDATITGVESGWQ
ncbi:hypothetical protein BX600DRAFT_389818 [Xylariales sp. PMI_506]|nr:hypothetical protein BX600DRAFT_389818 [Xylariales sp. PMI_506]